MITDPLEDRLRAEYQASDANYEPADAIQRLQARLPPRRRYARTLWGAATATGGAAIAAVVLLTQGTTAAYAGWATTPTTVSTSLLAPAASDCEHAAAQIASFEALESGAPFDVNAQLSLNTVLTEARGEYVAMIGLADSAAFVCIDGSGAGTGISAWRGAVPASPTSNLLSSGNVGSDVGSGSVNGHKVSGLGAGRLAFGRAGAGVTSITLAFAGHPSVEATITNGWYFAWWPWSGSPASVQVSSASGTESSAPDCQPASAGCVFSSAAPTS